MSIKNIEEVIRVINNHIKEYEKRVYPAVDEVYERGRFDGAIDILIDLRSELAQELKR